MNVWWVHVCIHVYTHVYSMCILSYICTYMCALISKHTQSVYMGSSYWKVAAVDLEQINTHVTAQTWTQKGQMSPPWDDADKTEFSCKCAYLRSKLPNQ